MLAGEIPMAASLRHSPGPRDRGRWNAKTFRTPCAYEGRLLVSRFRDSGKGAKVGPRRIQGRPTKCPAFGRRSPLWEAATQRYFPSFGGILAILNKRYRNGRKYPHGSPPNTSTMRFRSRRFRVLLGRWGGWWWWWGWGGGGGIFPRPRRGAEMPEYAPVIAAGPIFRTTMYTIRVRSDAISVLRTFFSPGGA